MKFLPHSYEYQMEKPSKMGFLKSYESLTMWLLLLMIVSSSAIDMSIISYDTQNTNLKLNSPRSDQEIRSIFEEWQVEHGKVYNALEDKQQRSEIFKDNLNFIDEHNARNESYELGLNEFSDLSFKEFSSKYLKSRQRDSISNSTAPYIPEALQEPVSVDWRTKGAVTPVKNQGDCGSCWSFGSVAAVEGLMKLSTQKIESLSEQEIIDCIKKDCSGKRGCSQEDAYGYIVNNGGITSSKNYPYVAAKRQCDNTKRKVKVFSITGFQQVGQSELALKKAVARQPVSVDLKVHREFQSYKSGVYKGKCGSILDHTVAVVGYDTTPAPENQAYWILKNSWGAGWGEKGFVKLQRNVRSSEGKCGIVLFANYPTKKSFNGISEDVQIY